MLDRLFSNPLVALGFLLAVVYLAMYYIAQRERSQVNQMRGGKPFSPKWSSGRRHRRGRRGAGRREGFSPQWNRRRRPEPGAEGQSAPQPRDPKTPEDRGDSPREPGN